MNQRSLKIFLFLAGLLLPFFYMVTAKMHTDYTQFYDRAYAIFDCGRWTHHGNQASGLLGHVPGTLSTFLTWFPMWIYHSPYSPVVFIFCLNLVALFLLHKILKESFPKKEVLLPLLLFFWINPWRVLESVLWNPAYLPFFAVIHLYCCFELSKNKNSASAKTFFYSFLLVFGVGLCVQLHLSAGILFFLSVFLWYKKLIRVSWWGISLGVVAVFLTIVPYVLSTLHEPALLSVPSDYNQGTFFLKNLVFVYPMVKSVLYWLRYSSFYFSKNIVQGLEFTWANSAGVLANVFEYFYRSILVISMIASTLAAIWLNLSLWKRKFQFPIKFKEKVFLIQNTVFGSDEKSLWLQSYLKLALLAGLVSTALSPVEFNYYHLLLLMPSSLLVLIIFWVEHDFKHKLYIQKGVITLCLMQNILTPLGSELHTIKTRFHVEFEKRYSKIQNRVCS